MATFLAVTVTVTVAVAVSLAPEASAHGTPPEIEVQAIIRDAVDPLRVNYQIATRFSDGDLVEADLAMTAVSDNGTTIEVMPEPTTPGIAIAEILYPEATLWTVRVVASNEDGTTTVSFTENLPWPHYAEEAGIPKVKADTANPDRAGTRLIPGTAEPAASEPTTGDSDRDGIDPPNDDNPAGDRSTAAGDAAPAPVIAAGPEPTTISRFAPADELRDDITMRLLHLAALGTWAVPVLAWVLGNRNRHIPRIALAGMAGTILTGLALMVWGAPLDAPGIFRWNELGDRLFGTTYQWAFLAKIAAATVAAGATLTFAVRRRAAPARIAMSGLGGAAVAVTVMTQTHLFTHL